MREAREVYRYVCCGSRHGGCGTRRGSVLGAPMGVGVAGGWTLDIRPKVNEMTSLPVLIEHTYQPQPQPQPQPHFLPPGLTSAGRHVNAAHTVSRAGASSSGDSLGFTLVTPWTPLVPAPSTPPSTPPPCPSNHTSPLSSPTTFPTTSRSSPCPAHPIQERLVRAPSQSWSLSHQTYTSFSSSILAIYRNAVFPEITSPQPGQSALTVHELFLSGMAMGADRPCLGWRPRISTNPVKFANKFEWLSYAQVNERRLNLGSAIEALFRSARAGGGELPTVGIWCQNRPGACSPLFTHTHAQTLARPFSHTFLLQWDG
jgi:hypothetical protein